jgi:sterol desaturase/sphingolipid hydroxylase (fatty acid hydroxylase superfamily)
MFTHLQGFAIDVARLALWLFLLTAIFVPLERMFAERRQPVLRKQFALDLGYYFLNGLVAAALLAGMAALLTSWLQRMVPAALLAATASLPLWPRILVTLAVADLGFYWGHRWSHAVPLLWRFHAIHHSAEHVDWLTNTRAHPVDLIFTRLCGFALIALLGLAQPGARAGAAITGLLAVFTTLYGFCIHANLRCRLGWLEHVIATPAFHRWHHTNDSNRDRNYAATLPLFDHVFGTLHLPPNEAPARFGIDAPISRSMTGQLLDPVMSPASPRAP